jgi:lactate permease
MAGVSMAWQAAAAAAPVLLILAGMLRWRWSAAKAGAAGLLLAWALALALFDFGAAAGQAPMLARHAGVLAEAGFLALGILWILLPALALHEHQQRCGATEALRAGLARVSDRPALQMLLLGWCLGLFLEGAAGFGTPIALVAPLLVGLGVPALTAVVLALLGHAAGVCFGALGTPVLAQAALTGVPAPDIAWRSAALQALLGGVLMAFFVRTLSAAGLGRVGAGWATLAAAGFLLPSLGLAAWLGPELATLGAALLSAAAVVAVLHGRRSRSGESADAAPALGRALWPYAVLVLAVLATRALPPLHGALNEVVLQWQVFGRYSGRLQPLTHPGTLLFLALLLGARLQGVPLRALGPPLMLALARLRPVALALLAMLCLSRLLLDAGMVQALQLAAVAALGQAWPLLAPALGALGSFVTGSATASNVLFSSLQAQTAQALGLPVAWLLAGQSLGAAVGNIVCPHNIVAGAATVGLAGREAEVLRRTWLPCMVYLVLAGLLLTLVSWR